MRPTLWHEDGESRRRLPWWRRSALAALALLLAFSLPAAADPADSAPDAAGAVSEWELSDGARALDEVVRRFRSLETYSAEFVQHQDWVGMDEGPAYRGTLYLKQPNLFRIEYSDPQGHLQVSDGAMVWTYVPENGEVLATRLSGAPGQGGDPLRWILETGRAEPDVGNDRVEGKAARVVTLVPAPEVGLSRVRLWMPPRSPELLQYEITDTAGNRTVYRLTRVRENPRLPASLFDFTPPPGVPVVELGS